VGEVIILPVVRVDREPAQTDGGKARMNRRCRRLFGDIPPIAGPLQIADRLTIADTAPCEYVAPPYDGA
jgi:hypothetical protein